MVAPEDLEGGEKDHLVITISEGSCGEGALAAPFSRARDKRRFAILLAIARRT